jgi:hypothetical protein
MRQAVSLTRDDLKNSSADANASAAKPCKRRNLAVASRTDSSSSTIETMGALDSRLILT